MIEGPKDVSIDFMFFTLNGTKNPLSNTERGRKLPEPSPDSSRPTPESFLGVSISEPNRFPAIRMSFF